MHVQYMIVCDVCGCCCAAGCWGWELSSPGDFGWMNHITDLLLVTPRPSVSVFCVLGGSSSINDVDDTTPI